MLQQQLQAQQNQRLEQIRQQHIAQMQSNSESSPQQQQTVSNSVPDLNSIFLNPPLPGTVAKSKCIAAFVVNII